MIYVAKNMHGEILGYLVEDLFISLQTWNCITDMRRMKVQEIQGEQKGIDFVSDDKRIYHSIYPLLNHKAFLNNLQILIKNDIVLRRYLYIHIKPKEIKAIKKKVDDFWTLCNFKYVYEIYDTQREEFVGLFCTSNDFYNNVEMSTHVCMFEIYEKQKGKGSQIIRDLGRYKHQLRGLSTESSKKFWDKLGAKYENNDLHFKIE